MPLAAMLFAIASGWLPPVPLTLPDWESPSTDYLKRSGCWLFAESAPSHVVARAREVLAHMDVAVGEHEHQPPYFGCHNGRAAWWLYFERTKPCAGCYFGALVGDRDHYVEIFRGE